MRLRSRHAPQKILPLMCLHSLGGTTEAVGSIPMGRAICRGGGYVCVPLSDEHIFRSIEVSIPACHAGDPGSIPGGRELFADPAWTRSRGLPGGWPGQDRRCISQVPDRRTQCAEPTKCAEPTQCAKPRNGAPGNRSANQWGPREKICPCGRRAAVCGCVRGWFVSGEGLWRGGRAV